MTKPKKFAQVYEFIKVTSRAERERHVAQMLANFRLEGLMSIRIKIAIKSHRKVATDAHW
jgi:hypothetical protein